MKQLLIIAALLTLYGCGSRQAVDENSSGSTAVVVKSITMPDVPSGSAIRIADDGSFWIVSDDAPYIYRVSADGRTLDSIHIIRLSTTLHRIPKTVKLDDEGAAITDVNGHLSLLAFGSGSLETARDSMAIIPLDGASQNRYALTTFYERLRQTAGITRDEFNIEGAALKGEQLIFLNRGTGHLIYTQVQPFLNEVMGATDRVAPISVARVEFPARDSFPPGFSDAAFLNETQLLFSASAEATTSWHTDGEVLGSWIGLLDISTPATPRLLRFSALVGQDGKPVKDKLEGIDLVRGRNGGVHEIIGVVDNDDGTSKLLHITLPL